MKKIQSGFALALLAGTSLTVMCSAATAQVVRQDLSVYTDHEAKVLLAPLKSDFGNAITAGAEHVTGNGPNADGSAYLVQGFDGVSQYDVAGVARNFIPPDTMGAAGTTQYMNFVNGGVGIYDKATGVRTSFRSDLAFWAAAGKVGANGDSRVMFDASLGRWIATSFGSSVSTIQIAVSDTANAAGGWKSTSFTGFAGGTADYPTLALDNNAVYIGTNNFNSAGSFRGTTLNIIPIASLFNATAPTVAGRATVTAAYPGTGVDGGFAIQGVNNTANTTTGKVLSASLYYDDVLTYNLTNVGTAAVAKTPTVYVGVADYANGGANGAGRQPNAVPDAYDANHNFNTDPATNNRVIDTLDTRIGSSVYEVNGRIYSVYTVTPLGSDYTYVRYDVMDATTNKLLDEGTIGDGAHDFYQGSLAVNKYGQVVIGYDRSGSGADGKISFLAQTFSTGTDGKLTKRGAALLLKVSAVDDYHNGSVDGFVADGRQRWGDYSAVSLDPTNDRVFWAIGEYALPYNDAAGGHPGGTGGSRWGTYIAEINAGFQVPEPASWALMLVGFGLVGGAVRGRKAVKLA